MVALVNFSCIYFAVIQLTTNKSKSLPNFENLIYAYNKCYG
jgi:hypothetical protein